MSEPRTWSMPEIPADVNRVTTKGGELLAERVLGWPNLWELRYASSGRRLGEIRTRDLLDVHSPLTEVPDA